MVFTEKLLRFTAHKHVTEVCDKIASESYGVKRADMPQIFGKNFEDFRQWLANQGTTCYEKQIIPSTYKATQCEFNVEKVLTMFKNGYVSEHGENPIIVSNDGYVIDGHHRWIKHYVQDDRPMKALEIAMSVQQVLDKMHEYDKVGYKSVKEQVL